MLNNIMSKYKFNEIQYIYIYIYIVNELMIVITQPFNCPRPDFFLKVLFSNETDLSFFVPRLGFILWLHLRVRCTLTRFF